jgi:hypothetical protein
MKNLLVGVTLAFILIACEGNSDPVGDFAIDKKEMDKTRAKIDSLPALIKKDYLKSDSLIHNETKKEIDLLKKEIAALKDEIKTLRKK